MGSIILLILTTKNMYSKLSYEDWMEMMKVEYDYSYSLLLEFEECYDESISNTANTASFMNMYFEK